VKNKEIGWVDKKEEKGKKNTKVENLNVGERKKF